MLADQAFPTDGCQAGVGMRSHGVEGLALLGRTTTLSASYPFVRRNNLVALHTWAFWIPAFRIKARKDLGL